MVSKAILASVHKAAQNTAAARQNSLTQTFPLTHTQTRTLYFCGPKAGAHDKPMPEHYFAGAEPERWAKSSYAKSKPSNISDKEGSCAKVAEKGLKEVEKLEKLAGNERAVEMVAKKVMGET